MNASTRCKNLRYKSMFIPALAKETVEHEQQPGHAPHCWCNCTLTETGPDERPVGPEVCRPSRPCFEE